MEDRRNRILSGVDPDGQRGLEIGPLNRPVVERAPGRFVLYADHLSTEGLRAKYAPHAAVDPAAIVDVDVVVPDGTSLRAALGQTQHLDYVVASHVIEHLPDTIGWLRDIAACLRPGGHLCLAVPDKRFTFDRFRQTTRVADLVEAHLGRVSVPTPAQVYDAIAFAAQVEPVHGWRDPELPWVPLDGHGPGCAILRSREAADGHYHDVHCTVFTPASFTAVLGQAIALDLVPFAFGAVHPTDRFGSEFFATLVHRPDLAPADRAATAPILDRSKHHDLPRSAPEAAARGWRAAFRWRPAG